MAELRGATPDIEALLDNAACASQVRELLRDDEGEETVLREAVRMNVVEPLLKVIRSAKAPFTEATAHPDHPVSARCALEGCRDFERSATRATRMWSQVPVACHNLGINFLALRDECERLSPVTDRGSKT